MNVTKQRGMTLTSMMVAVAIGSVMSLYFVQHVMRDMDRGLITLTSQRMKLVYESAITYRGDNGVWPGNTGVLTAAGYVPAAAAANAWGNAITLTPAGNNLLISTLAVGPSEASQVAGKMPAAAVVGNTVTDTIVRPGQEASNNALYARDGSRPLTGAMDAGGNAINNLASVSIGGQDLNANDALLVNRLATLNCSASQYVRIYNGGVSCVSTSSSVPRNTVAAFNQTSCPPGWSNFSQLDNRFIVGRGSSYGLGATGGASYVRLTAAQMPAHRHLSVRSGYWWSGSGPSASRTIMAGNNLGGNMNQYMLQGVSAEPNVGRTSIAGSNGYHENRPPYYALKWCIKW